MNKKLEATVTYNCPTLGEQSVNLSDFVIELNGGYGCCGSPSVECIEVLCKCGDYHMLKY